MSLFCTNAPEARAGALISASNAQDTQVVDGPPDSVSSLAWSPVADLLAAGSWDGGVRIWEVNAQGQSQGKAMYSHPAPVLSVCWNKAGTQVFSAGADNAVRMLDLQVNPNEPQQVAAHDGPIRVVKWFESPQGPILVTGSWDKTLKYWDMRSPNPIATVQLAERCYALDIAYPLLVVGTAERHIHIINLTNPGVIYKTIESPLKWQTRSICCFPTGDAFTIGSVEGRVAIQYVEEKDATKNYAFKCHRRDAVPNSKDGALVYPINHMTFHPVHGTLATCGSDGDVVVWDLNVRVRCKSYDIKSGPITTAAFSARGNFLAYACSYDWHKGHSGMTVDHPNKIMVHQVSDVDVQKRPPRR